MNSEYGYNEESLNRIFISLREDYESNVHMLSKLFQEAVIDNIIAPGWYAPEAITAAREITKREKEVCKYFYDKWKYIFDTVLAGAQRWATTVGTTYVAPNGNDFGPDFAFEFDISHVMREKQGVIAILEDLLDKIAYQVEMIRLIVTGNLETTCVWTEQQTSAFLGDDQMQNLIQTIRMIVDKINTTVEENMEFIKKKIEGTTTKYKEVARANAALFYSAPPPFVAGN